MTRVIRHEIGHALDAVWSVIAYANRVPPSALLWHAFASQRRGLLRPHSSDHPCEYVADALTDYFERKARLRSLDPAMHAFMQAVFALSNR